MTSTGNPLRASLLAIAALSAACTPMARTGEEAISPEEMRLRAVETRLTEVNRRVLAAENKDETKTLTEISQLRGEIERLRFDLDTQVRRNKDLTADYDRRLQKLEAQPTPAASVAPAADAPPLVYTPPPVVTAPVGGTPAAEEQAAYLKAFAELKAGRYDGAIAGFKGVLDQWPQGNFSDNAWFWMAESHYAKKQYKPALDAYGSLIGKFPSSPKIPDAIFKSGVAQLELKQVNEAKASWRRVMKDYPNSNAAGLARQRLATTP